MIYASLRNVWRYLGLTLPFAPKLAISIISFGISLSKALEIRRHFFFGRMQVNHVKQNGYA